jgi:hypothetical protein
MRKAVVGALVLAAIVVGFLIYQHGSHGSGGTAHKDTPVGKLASAKSSGPHEEPAASVLFDDDPAGTLRLEGLVVDAEDHPVGGATVTLSSHPPHTATTGSGH